MTIKIFSERSKFKISDIQDIHILLIYNKSLVVFLLFYCYSKILTKKNQVI